MRLDKASMAVKYRLWHFWVMAPCSLVGDYQHFTPEEGLVITYLQDLTWRRALGDLSQHNRIQMTRSSVVQIELFNILRAK
jgi:hypothetical protein